MQCWQYSGTTYTCRSLPNRLPHTMSSSHHLSACRIVTILVILILLSTCLHAYIHVNVRGPGEDGLCWILRHSGIHCNDSHPIQFNSLKLKGLLLVFGFLFISLNSSTTNDNWPSFSLMIFYFGCSGAWQRTPSSVIAATIRETDVSGNWVTLTWGAATDVSPWSEFM